MQQAVSLGNRLIMMHQGKIAYDFKGDAKKHLKVQDLLQLFDQLRKKDNIDLAVTNLLTDIYV